MAIDAKSFILERFIVELDANRALDAKSFILESFILTQRAAC
jgi:hypothetical protein